MTVSNSIMSHDGRILPSNYRIPSSCDGSISSSLSSSSDDSSLSCSKDSLSSFSDNDKSISSFSSSDDDVADHEHHYQQQNPQEEEAQERKRPHKGRKKNRYIIEEDAPMPRALELNKHVINSIHSIEEEKYASAEYLDKDELSSLPNKPQQRQQGTLRPLMQLYGRSKEEASLLEAYRNRMNLKKGASHLAAVSGASGTGKSVLAQSLQDHVGNGPLSHHPQIWMVFGRHLPAWPRKLQKVPTWNQSEPKFRKS